jgi:hypothetical protein
VRTLVQPKLEEARSFHVEGPLLAGRRFTDLQTPLSVVDLPVCTTTFKPRLLASAPKDPNASLASPPRCE